MISGLTLMDKVEVNRLAGAVAAGSSDYTSGGVVTTKNRDLFSFVVGFGAVTSGAATSIEIHGSSDGGSTYALMTDDAGDDCSVTVADTDDSKCFLIEVVKPLGAIDHLKCVIKRATQNSVVEFILCLVGNSRTLPTTQPSGSVVSVNRFVGAS